MRIALFASLLALVAVAGVRCSSSSSSECSPQECSGPNESYREGTCDLTCDVLAPACTAEPHLGCFCDEGYGRNAKGVCVLRTKCVKCGQNEQFTECVPCPPGQICPAVCLPGCICKKGFERFNGKCIKSCTDKNTELGCLPCPPGRVCAAICRPGCVCKKGFKKNAKGVCVADKLKCKPTEEYKECPAYCSFDRTCQSELRGATPKCARPPPNWKCTPTCNCKEGFVRIDKNCVPIEQCCPSNQTVVDCPALGEETCDWTKPTPDIQCRRKFCRCQEGFVRDVETRDCVARDVCSKTCKAFEEYREGTCDGTCENPNAACKIKNHWACFCMPGYVRDENQRCIRLDECVPKCTEDEVLNKCPPYCTFDPDCLSEVRDIRRMCSPPRGGVFECRPRCYCKPGLVRIDQQCLPIEKCCKANEELLDCPVADEETCDWTKMTQIERCTKKFCRCLDGFIRDENGACQPRLDVCSKTCKNNEEYRIGTCDATCANPSYQCRVKNHWACFCLPGHVRDENNQCVLLEDCPITCGENEVFSGCIPCPPGMICPAVCRKGCICKEGFSRNAEGKCVETEKSCGENEIFTQCMPRACPPGMMCPTVCIPGCVCKKGYQKNQSGVCVKVEKCGKGQTFNPCIGYCSFDENCPKLFNGLVPGCPAPPPNLPRCYTSGCRCNPGLVRIENDCVAPDKCCTGANEIAVDCPAECDLDVNGNRLPDCKCFTKGCRCKKGFVRDNAGACIKKKVTKPTTTKPTVAPTEEPCLE